MEMAGCFIEKTARAVDALGIGKSSDVLCGCSYTHPEFGKIRRASQRSEGSHTDEAKRSVQLGDDSLDSLTEFRSVKPAVEEQARSVDPLSRCLQQVAVGPPARLVGVPRYHFAPVRRDPLLQPPGSRASDSTSILLAAQTCRAADRERPDGRNNGSSWAISTWFRAGIQPLSSAHRRHRLIQRHGSPEERRLRFRS